MRGGWGGGLGAIGKREEGKGRRRLRVGVPSPGGAGVGGCQVQVSVGKGYWVCRGRRGGVWGVLVGSDGLYPTPCALGFVLSPPHAIRLFPFPCPSHRSPLSHSLHAYSALTLSHSCSGPRHLGGNRRICTGLKTTARGPSSSRQYRSHQAVGARRVPAFTQRAALCISSLRLLLAMLS